MQVLRSSMTPLSAAVIAIAFFAGEEGDGATRERRAYAAVSSQASASLLVSKTCAAIAVSVPSAARLAPSAS